MVQLLGYHDAYASGVIHAISGGSALAILIHLGPRIGRFRPDGTARNFPPHNTWLVVIGLFLIYTGFWGFYAACNVPIIDIDGDEGRLFFSATTIYLTPTTLSAITFNFLMSLRTNVGCCENVLQSTSPGLSDRLDSRPPQTHPVLSPPRMVGALMTVKFCWHIEGRSHSAT